MVPLPCVSTVPVPPPSSQRAVHKHPTALPVTALTVVTTVHVRDWCRLAVERAHRRCPSPLPKVPVVGLVPPVRSRW